MKLPSNLGHLKTDQWEFLQDCADRFENAWQKSATVDLAQFLPPPGHPLRLVTLQELIKTDLEIRWRRGQVLGLEYYLEKYPELGPPQDLPPQLIFEEYRIRHLHGDKPDLQHYHKRFPAQFAQTIQRRL